jgi:hypothetical protein
VRTYADVWADAVTRLTGDDVETGDIENLLVALRRAGVLSSDDLVQLLGNYLDEQRDRRTAQDGKFD